MNTHRKIIQIATSNDGRVHHALCDDGSLWLLSNGNWHRIDTTVVEQSSPLPPVGRAS